MRYFYTYLIAGLGLLLLSSCEIKPEPINYGSDVCQFCSMTIVDQQHASELVTTKGKAFKFDSVECLLNYDQEPGRETAGMYLCNHFNQPGELIHAEQAIFLISDGIPSPMGAYLTAFSSIEEAEAAKEEHGGSVFTWDELINHWQEEYVYYE